MLSLIATLFISLALLETRLTIMSSRLNQATMVMISATLSIRSYSRTTRLMSVMCLSGPVVQKNFKITLLVSYILEIQIKQNHVELPSGPTSTPRILSWQLIIITIFTSLPRTLKYRTIVAPSGNLHRIWARSIKIVRNWDIQRYVVSWLGL